MTKVIYWNPTNLATALTRYHSPEEPDKSTSQAITKRFGYRDELNTEECFNLINQVAEFAPGGQIIFTSGDPLLREDILELISYSSSRGLRVILEVNGLIITAPLLHKLKSWGLTGLSLILESPTAHIHDKIQGVKGAWENTLRTMEVLEEVGMPGFLRTTVGRHNIGQLGQIVGLLKTRKAIKYFHLKFTPPGTEPRLTRGISKEEYKDALLYLKELETENQLHLSIHTTCTSMFLDSTVHNSGACPAEEHFLNIFPNGDLTPCPNLPQVGGNIKQMKLKQIQENSEVFRNLHSPGVIQAKFQPFSHKQNCFPLPSKSGSKLAIVRSSA